MAGALKRRPPGAGAGPHRFEMTPDFVSRLENPERIAGMPSGEIVSRMSIRKADVIADLGAGIGYFTFPLAAKAKSVIAIDLEPNMIQELSDRIAARKAKNIVPVLGEILHLPLRDQSVNGILAACVYHEVESQGDLVAECSRVLRPEGILTIVDFQKRETSFGPPVRERKSPAEVMQVVRGSLRLVSRHDSDIYYQLSFQKRP